MPVSPLIYRLRIKYTLSLSHHFLKEERVLIVLPLQVWLIQKGQGLQDLS